MVDTTPQRLNDLAHAAEAAVRPMRRSSAAERAAWMEAIADALDAHVDELVELAHRETHLTIERLRGEVARTTGQLRFFGDVIREGSYLEATIDHADPARTPPRPDLRRMLVPVGVVAVYAASNFPFAFSVAGGDTASALAVGCPVIVKAHSGHPELSRATARLVAEALRSAGAPEGAFALIEGREAGVHLIEHPVVKAAGFTGSVSGGRALFDRAAARPDPIPFYGELGSINPVVVTPAADAARGDELAAGLAASFQLGSGQFCTKPGVVFVPAGSRLEAELPAHVSAADHTLLTSSIAEGFGAGVAALLAAPGVEAIAGTAPGAAPRAIVARTSLADLAERAEVILAEVFGPATVLVTYESLDDLPSVLARLEGSLTATIHAQPDDDIAAIQAVFEERAGRLLFAGWPTGVAVTWAQQHGGPWPATTSLFTSVGATATRRFLRPVAYQDAMASRLPTELREENPLGIPRRVDGVLHA